MKTATSSDDEAELAKILSGHVHVTSFKDKSPLGYDFIGISSNASDIMTATQQFCQDTGADISGNAV